MIRTLDSGTILLNVKDKDTLERVFGWPPSTGDRDVWAVAGLWHRWAEETAARSGEPISLPGTFPSNLLKPAVPLSHET